MADDGAPAQDPKTGRFVTGNIGGGRPKGARNKLGEEFVQDLYADWQEHGVATLQRVRVDKPDVYLKTIASLLPKQVDVRVEPYEEMSDEQLRKHAERLIADLGPVAAFAAGGNADSAEEKARRKSLN